MVWNGKQNVQAEKVYKLCVVQMFSFVSQNEYGCSLHDLKPSVDKWEEEISIQQNCGSRNVASVTALPIAKVQPGRFPDNVLS